MNAERLLQLYDRVADAPDAVPRLRRLVLDLAVRGKLVEQDPADEPASAFLERIADEKARLVKAGTIRKPRDLSKDKELEQPFQIPATWRWCRLDTVGAIIGGGTPPASDAENFAEPGDGIPWLTPADLGGYRDLYIERGARDLSEKGLSSSSATMMPVGTVLFTSRAPIGYVAIAANPISTNQGFKSVAPYVAESSRFIALVLRTFAPDIDAKAPGTTFKEVSGKLVAEVPFPLPPLAEQHRIIGKVDELMALCDRLEDARATRETTRDRLTAASLARLTAPDTDAEAFPAQARFALDTLPALTARPDQIKQLRQSILNLAVRGKLVEQDPADDPASLAKHKVEDEPPFDAPLGWQWVPFSAVAAFENGDRSKKYPKRAEYVAAGVPWINTGHIEPDGTLSRSTMHYITEEKFASLGGGKIRPGDLVYCLRGATFGKTAFVEPYEKGAIASSLMIIRPGEPIDRRYAFIYLTSPLGREQLRRFDNGTAQPNLSSASVKKYQIPLPPLAEQHRIVAKVDALMALCDRLEAALATADTTRQRLLEALLHEALTPGEEREAAA